MKYTQRLLTIWINPSYLPTTLSVKGAAHFLDCHLLGSQNMNDNPSERERERERVGCTIQRSRSASPSLLTCHDSHLRSSIYLGWNHFLPNAADHRPTTSSFTWYESISYSPDWPQVPRLLWLPTQAATSLAISLTIHFSRLFSFYLFLFLFQQ